MRVICENCVDTGCGEWMRFLGEDDKRKCDCECHKIRANTVYDDPDVE